MRWPNISAQTELAQVKVAGTAPLSSLSQPARQGTQGVPQAVSSVSATKRILTATTCRVTVSFARNPGDPYFTQAKAYLKLGSGVPSLVAEGTTSPLTFVTARTGVPATVFVVSIGNWGSTALANSPGKALSLA
jgi:hypothetical protein